jgi:DNA polymerase I-like protein with 3'-5' exonuclease and polymerase domains
MPDETDKERFKRLDAMRSGAKVVNYSALYGVGASKLARESGMTVKEAEVLLKAFWDLNWAIQKIAKESYVKTLKDGSMWVKNPVSGFYYSLRYDKDRWSTINQSTGVYIFDLWVANMRKLGIHPQAQMHDEVLFSVPKGQEKQTEELLKEAMRKVNETLKLNVTIGADAEFGESYASVH